MSNKPKRWITSSLFYDTKKLIESLFFNKHRYLKIKANQNINSKMQNIRYTYVANVSPEN